MVTGLERRMKFEGKEIWSMTQRVQHGQLPDISGSVFVDLEFLGEKITVSWSLALLDSGEF